MTTDIAGAAASLLQARQTRHWLTALPEAQRPTDSEAAYAIIAETVKGWGPIKAWKVGAASLTAEPNCAPLFGNTVFEGVARLEAARFNRIGVEAELGYRFGRDLPPRETPYTREEVLEAVATMHPMIEIADTRFQDFKTTDALSHFCDQGTHGALVIGPPQADWRGLDPVTQRFVLTLDGAVAMEREGGNSAVDPVRLLVWLANTGARRWGGLKAGHVVTSGAVTGMVPRDPGVKIHVGFPGLGEIGLEVA
jgi:2-keto-4-pentenoate hydratase